MPPQGQKRPLAEVDSNVGAASNANVDYNQLTIADLKEKLKSRDLKIGGTKPELVERLQDADNGNVATGKKRKGGGDSTFLTMRNWNVYALPDLKDEAKSRGLPVSGSKMALVKRLTQSNVDRICGEGAAEPLFAEGRPLPMGSIIRQRVRMNHSPSTDPHAPVHDGFTEHTAPGSNSTDSQAPAPNLLKAKAPKKAAPKKKSGGREWITMFDYGRLEVPELQRRLRSRGLNDAGSKRALVNRLEDADLQGINSPPPDRSSHLQNGPSEMVSDPSPPTNAIQPLHVGGLPAPFMHHNQAAPVGVAQLANGNFNAYQGPPILPPPRANWFSKTDRQEGPMMPSPSWNSQAFAPQPRAQPQPQPQQPQDLTDSYRTGIPATYNGMKQPELKEELRRRELKISGSTPELVARLQQSDLDKSLPYRQAMEAAAKQRRDMWAAKRGPDYEKPDSLESIRRHDKKYEECVRRGPNGAPVYDDMGYQLSYERCSKIRKTMPHGSQINWKKQDAWMTKCRERDQKMCEIMGVLNKDSLWPGVMEWRVAKDLQIPLHTVDVRDFEEWKRQGFSIANQEELQNLSAEEKELELDLTTGSAFRVCYMG